MIIKNDYKGAIISNLFIELNINVRSRSHKASLHICDE